mmetsp:Transcript_23264/g.39773  ORF Transcript_23264/g.39773 Transcript_23264/m.39773 type:complete len:127 (-) Transcript_23264:88-468(-)|eukprot:CAMPEP_0183727726 /NCGR_PEP_ID=MMETSP0737-20130205/26245_1 /TAXON_ID=385413 /ORGANISM="Thalassiosira miniscula, Strain CCMP1093" /LENGTH=126 /DNA_ID=CAMNT_0025959441 /DNA_START=16 /DNA_END=396 /DNA_ORIENTATION=-
MSQTQTMTATETPLQKVAKKQPFLFSISEKNETLFQIKQIATAVHFLSLIGLGFLYILEHEKQFHCFILTAIAFVCAMFIPPTGLIKPNDAPEYAKNSMSYMQNPHGTGALQQQQVQETKKSKKQK